MKRNKTPRFKNKKEEARFWETHSLTDYLGDLEQVDHMFAVSPALSRKIRKGAKPKVISIRLAQWEIELAKKIAHKRNMPYQRLLREWIDIGIKRSMM